VGLLEGESLPCGLFCSYFSFKGIPYAVAPLGNRRFRAPVAHPGWDGVRQALKHGNNCPTGGLLGSYEGDEDCLFLNVYSRNLVGRRPVMVWIHGGSFTGGNGDNSTYGPEYYMVDDVVLVTINYRIGYLGFLSTGDAAAPGNWGLKDAVEALRWVKENIARFGGDPDNVTIFGESAGSVIVNFLMLSELAKGLFHKAISQSGMALNPWAFQPEPLRVAEDLAQELRILYTSTADLVNQLRMLPFQDLIGEQDGWLSVDRPRGFAPFDIAPCAEPNSNVPFIIDRHPLEIMKSGNWNDVPYIIGYNSDESMFMQREHLFDFSVHRFFSENPWAWVPELWNVPRSHPDTVTIMNEFQKLYLEGEEPSRQRDQEWTWVSWD
jgi:bile salt-stimulated lipase